MLADDDHAVSRKELRPFAVRGKEGALVALQTLRTMNRDPLAGHAFGQRIDLTSGFRYHERKSSRHANAAAADVSIPGLSARKLYDFATTLDAGGMGLGYYPRSGFIHVDRRAPGAQSYRWTDYGSSSSGKSKSRPKSKKKREVKPNT